MKTKFTYDELSAAGQLRARLDYFAGWKDTHPFETMDADELHDILLNNDDTYTYEGGHIGE